MYTGYMQTLLTTVDGPQFHPTFKMAIGLNF